MTRERVLLAAACACQAAVVVYAVLRVAQAAALPEPNPAVVGAGVHSGYFWRAWIAAYGGGFVGLVFALVIPPSDRIVAMATRALPITAALLLAQALFVP